MRIYVVHHLSPFGIVQVIIKLVRRVVHKRNGALLFVNICYHIQVHVRHRTIIIRHLKKMRHNNKNKDC